MSSYVAPGLHLLIDLYEAKGLGDLEHVEAVLKSTAELIGATLLKIELHSFGENCGVTGVAILAESHISIHTWPEIDYAAIDIFVCGTCDPRPAKDFFKKQFCAVTLVATEIPRGKRSEVEERARA